MNKRVKDKRTTIAFCTYRELVDKFRKQSYEMNKSMSRRIEEFMISELEKENNKNEN